MVNVDHPKDTLKHKLHEQLQLLLGAHTVRLARRCQRPRGGVLRLGRRVSARRNIASTGAAGPGDGGHPCSPSGGLATSRALALQICRQDTSPAVLVVLLFCAAPVDRQFLQPAIEQSAVFLLKRTLLDLNLHLLVRRHTPRASVVSQVEFAVLERALESLQRVVDHAIGRAHAEGHETVQ